MFGLCFFTEFYWNWPQFSSVSQSYPTLWNPMYSSMPDFPVHHQLLEPTQTHVHNISDAIQPYHPQLSPSPPTINLSQHQGLFQWVGSSHQVAKVLEFQLQHQSFQWVFRTDFLQDWLVGSPWSSFIVLLIVCVSTTVQKHQCFSAQLSFFIVQFSHLYMTTEKTIALTIWTFAGKVMTLIFNMLSSLVIAVLPKSKHLLISWLQSPSAVILEPKKIKSGYFYCFPIFLPWSDGTRSHDLSFLNVEF